jgi:predicted MFS family arabinose efflux permease
MAHFLDKGGEVGAPLVGLFGGIAVGAPLGWSTEKLLRDPGAHRSAVNAIGVGTYIFSIGAGAVGAGVLSQHLSTAMNIACCALVGGAVAGSMAYVSN